MTPEEKLAAAAIKWFKSKKPAGIPEKEHVKVAEVNCTTESDRQLAKAVSAYIVDTDSRFWSGRLYPRCQRYEDGQYLP